MHNQEHMEKNIMGSAEAAEFAAGAAYEPEAEPLSCCVDGRYEAGDRAAAAAPGGDAGKMLEAFAALEYAGIKMTDALREEVLDAVVAAVGGPEKFRFHTDHHAAEALKDRSPEESVARGCGHVRLASESPHAYGLTSEDMGAIFRRLVTLRSGEVVLEGGHEESAVMVITDRKQGLAHQKGGVQAFVYHEGWDNARLERLAAKLAGLSDVKAAEISAERLTDILISMASLQRNLTLAKLASGLPIYAVTNGKASEAGIVGASEEKAA
jgi:hypothetical protein